MAPDNEHSQLIDFHGPKAGLAYELYNLYLTSHRVLDMERFHVVYLKRILLKATELGKQCAITRMIYGVENLVPQSMMYDICGMELARTCQCFRMCHLRTLLSFLR